MANFNRNLPGKINSDVYPSRFLRPDPNIQFGYVQASSPTEEPAVIGISQEGTKQFPTASNSSLAGSAGDSIQIFWLGDICPLTAGSGGWENGDELKTDADGKGVVASSGNSAAVALSTCAENELGLVMIRPRTQ